MAEVCNPLQQQTQKFCVLCGHRATKLTLTIQAYPLVLFILFIFITATNSQPPHVTTK